MFAILETGGKQYRVENGKVLHVEKLEGEEGGRIKLTSVLVLGEEGKDIHIGKPFLEGAFVEAELLSQGRARKLRVFKKKRRANYRRLHGHRQEESIIRVTAIVAGTAKATATAAKPAQKSQPAQKAQKPTKTTKKVKPDGA